jgi:DNA-binding protein HU-beta
MNKNELMKEIAERTGVSKKDAEAVVHAFTDVVTEVMAAGDKITLVGFGTFESVEVGERTGTIQLGDRKGETYVVPQHKSPRFKASKTLKDTVNK